jgi:hypothetical protein
MSGLFGKTAKERSTNVNRGMINDAFGGVMGATGDSVNALQALLGGDATGFRRFTDAIDLSGQAEYGSRGITGNAAARGLLRSGSTGRALVDYEQMLENQAANQYMQNLLGVGQLGLGAGGLVADVGRESRGKAKDKSKLGEALGYSLVRFSDRRLKKDIKLIGRTDEGLNVYEFRYIDGSGPYTGVMAQEVAEMKPEALGPTVNGYMTVDYSKINPNFYYKVS